MVIWFFENNQFANAWVPFDRANQKKLEYIYRHHDDLVYQLSEEKSVSNKNQVKFDIDSEEEDDSAHSLIQFEHNCIHVILRDSHFEHEITLYPAMLLGSLPDRDILIVRAERMDHKINI
jgi:hypothetical protein